MALGIALAVLPIIADHTIVPIKTHVCYALYCKTNLQNLEEEVAKLKNAWSSLKLSADEERRGGKTIHQHVTQWLNEVDALIKESESRSSEDENRRKKRCFIGLCPDFSTRYKLGKNAKKRLATVTAKLEEKAKLGPVAYHAAPMGMDHVVSVKGYEAMASRNKIFDDIVTALRVGCMKMIGVYGMGGIGKTTLVKMVAREAVQQKLFDKMVIATVTQNPNTMKIQQEIGDGLGLTFKDKVEECGRAIQLREFLKKEKKILIVLDDLWERLDLDAVGISFQDEQKDCKMLLTSRELDVLSKEMDVHNNFQVTILKEEEAWDLFQKTAGGNVANPEVRPTAMKIATKCGGLPVAIVTIAKALKGRSLSEWKDAWCQLQRPSPGNFTGVSREVYKAIELSYRHLRTDEHKSTFLFCSRMGYNSSIDDLLKYGMGLDLFSYVATTEEARNRASSLVRELKSSCLLLDGNTSNQFSIHDVVRDVAISIAFRDQAVFVSSNDGIELRGPGRNSQRKYREIWLHGENVRIFEDLNCKNLEMFIMKSKDASTEIPEEVFEGMKKLKVLGLTNLSFSSMPSSLHLLKNLHSLCIHQSLLGKTAVIGQLKQLEILSFAESSIKHLPREIGKLKKLKLLDLTDCSELEVISPNIISSLSLLQELHLGNSFHRWDIGEHNASLMELKHLSRLSNLDIHVPDFSIISKDLFPEKLERYKIFIGDVWDWHDLYETSRTLKLKFRENTDHLKPGISMLLTRTEDLYLLELKGIKNVICELNSEGFPHLKHLHLQNSRDIRYVIDVMDMDGIVSDDSFFPMLESLFLLNLASLKKIQHGRLGSQSFGKLQILEVEDCVELENLFSFSTEQDANDQIIIEGIESSNIMEFFHLRSICLKNLPNLISFCSTNKASGSTETQSKSTEAVGMESGDINSEEEMLIPVPVLFDGKIMLPMLEDLQLVSIGKIERLWHGQLSVVVSIQNLQRLEVRECHSLKYMFSLSMVKSLVQLKRLSISSCKSMETIIAETEALEEEETKILFPELEDIGLMDLPKLKRFCSGSLIECPLLKTLTVHDCDTLEAFISDCESRKVTVSNDDSGEVKLEQENRGSVKPPLFNEKLRNFKRKSHPIPFHFLQRLPNVETMSVCNSSIRRLFLFEGFEDEEYIRMLARFRNLNLERVHDKGNLWEQNHRLVPLLHNLRTLRVERCGGLVNLAPSSASFQNLSTLDVSDCNGLSNLITSSTIKSFVQLVKLTISGCSRMTEIVAKEEGEIEDDEIVFNKLEYLELCRLENLTCFCSENYVFEFPSLKEVTVEECPKMSIFSLGRSSTPELQGVCSLNYEMCWRGDLNATIQYLYIEMVGLCGRRNLNLSDFPQLKKRWHNQLPLYFFSNLTDLTVDDCAFFSNALSSNQLQFMNQLSSLRISNCNSLKEVFDLEGINSGDLIGDQILPNLIELQLTDLSSLRHICNTNPQGILDFRNLQSLKVCNCSSFINIFTPSMVLCLMCLKTIEIRNCQMLEEIITKGRGKEEAEVDKIVFHALEVIILDSLSNLTAIFSGGSDVLLFPLLEGISIENCPNLKTFVSSFLREQIPISIVEGQKHSFQKQVSIFPKMESLSMGWKDIMEIVQSNRFRVEYFSQLQGLSLVHFSNDYADFPFHFLQRFTNLKLLILRDASFKEIVFYQVQNDEESHTNILAQLEGLVLSKLPKLVHLPKEDPPTSQIYQKLATLTVLECGMLGSLIPSSLSFHCLTTLEVSKCHGLTKLMTSSSAKYLEELKEMSITECEMIEEIVADAENDVEKKVIFHNLKKMRLECLPNLTGFHMGKCAFMFPLLEKVLLIKCPKMKFFSDGVINTPELESVLLTKEDKEGYWEDDLNSTVQKLYFEMGDGAAQFKPPSTPKQPILTSDITQTDRNRSTDVSERQVSEDLCAAGTLEANKDLPPIVATIFENKETVIEVVSIESKVTEMIVSSSQDFDEALIDKDLTQGQNSSTSNDFDTQNSRTLQKDPQTSEKDEPSGGNVLIPVPFQQSNNIPVTPGTSVEHVSMLTSTSWSNRTPSQELTLVCANRNIPTAGFERQQVTEDLHSTGMSETCNDLSTTVTAISKKKETFLLTESKITKIASSFQDFNTTSNEKEDPTHGQNSSISIACEAQICLPVQKDLQETLKDEPSPGNGVLGVSLQQCNSMLYFEEQISVDSNATGTPETSKDLTAVGSKILKNKYIEVALAETKIPQKASSFQDLFAASTEKDVALLDKVMLGVSHQQSISSPKYATSVEQDLMLTSTSSTNRTSYEELITLGCETTEAERNSPTDVFERQVSEDVHSTGTLETNKDLPPAVATMLENKETLVLTDSKTTGIASSFQGFNATSNDQEDPAQDSSTPMGSEAQISPPVQNNSQATEKDDPSPDNVMLEVSLHKSNSCPKSAGTSVEQVSMLTSAALSTNRNSSPELTFSSTSCFNVPVESLSSDGVSLEIYRYCVDLIKELLTKSPAEVAESADRLLLRSSLKNLRSCPFLNSQQEEIIQLYIESLDSLVTRNPFYEQKIDWTSAIKISIEDHNRVLSELDISEEDLIIKINRLHAEEDALNKRLCEIEEEKGAIRAKQKVLHAQRVSREGKLEVERDALLEAETQQRETEDRANLVNENWAKFRNLFAKAFELP